MDPAKAPSITPEMVAAAIVDETYTVLPNGRTTICQLTLYNGFTVEGSSACVSIERFNAELGNKYSRERAVNKVWEHLGFLLADRLNRKPLSSADAAADLAGEPRPDWVNPVPEALRWLA